VAPRGECRTDLQILQALAARLGFGPDMAGPPSYWIDELTEPFRAQGISYGALAAAGGRLWPEGTPRVPWADGKFETASGRFAFPAAFDDDPVLPAPDYPLHLLALATAGAVNSQIPEERQRGRLTARVHPAVVEAAGLRPGAPAALVSPRGRLEVTLEADATVRRDAVLVPKGEWAKHGRGLNVLVEPRCTAGTGTAYNQNFVRIEPA
jgi:anaerobic selenocysteine-containing dehydrogenase